MPLGRSLAPTLAAGALFWSSAAFAQAPAEPAAPDASPPPAAGDVATPPPSAGEPPPPTVAPKPEPVQPGMPPGPPPPSLIPDGEAPKKPIPPAFPPQIPNIDYGARVRAALKFQDPQRPQRMDDIGEQMDADLYMSGQVHRYFKWQASVTMAFTGTAGASNSITIQPLDVLAKFEPIPEFNVYLGRMLVMADRFAPSGPWGMDEFFIPGFFMLVGPPALPKGGPTGRDLGANVWGAPFGGHAKYYLGVYNLNDPASNPLLSGRVQVSLLNGEPNWFQRYTYYGTKDLLSAGIGGQYQKAGSVQPVPTTTPPTVPKTEDFKFITGDLTFEKNIGDAGTLSVVGTYSKFFGKYNPWKDYWLGSIGYMLPKPIGIGKPRVTLRYQRGTSMAENAKATSLYEAQLSYLIAAWFCRPVVGYRRGDTWLPPTMTTPAVTKPSNMLYLGITVGDP
ncbi:MAG TPA: hypothetical protein VGQ57_07440 [Polyangiaceae bacterium]|jgi:hypothetical protein|nr:hypothetical protein [Polyangiaceae bacterium]